MKITKSANRAVGVIDAVETEIQPKPPENSSESTIHLQHHESSVTVEKRPEFDDPSIDNSQKTQENKLNVNCFQISSSSSECFVLCTVAPEGSDLDAQSDTALAHMDRSIRSKVINPENNNRASTSSSEYFLPYKASSRKRKLSGNTKESQESILNEADVESQSVIISSLSQSMLKIVLQHHLRST
nr:hypothetical transcript [Hymenolepis microstoma]